MGIVEAEGKGVLSALETVGGENLILALDIINWHSKVLNLLPVQECGDVRDIAVVCVSGLAYAAFNHDAVTLELEVYACCKGLLEYPLFHGDNTLKALLKPDGLGFFHVNIDAVGIFFVA
jgi:hypothetical protein